MIGDQKGWGRRPEGGRGLGRGYEHELPCRAAEVGSEGEEAERQL